MPVYIITLKEEATDGELNGVKETVNKYGGKVLHEYTIIKGFSAELPDNMVSVLSQDETIENVEQDTEVRIN